MATITGMFGTGKTYFSGSPVVIDITGLQWSSSSPFDIVRVNVIDKLTGNVVGDFHADTGGQSEIPFDIQSALRSIWADYDFANEVTAATKAHGHECGRTKGGTQLPRLRSPALNGISRQLRQRVYHLGQSDVRGWPLHDWCTDRVGAGKSEPKRTPMPLT